MSRLLVGLPTYDDNTNTRQALSLYAARMDSLETKIKTLRLSALCWCFNQLWADALNDRTYDYFLLLHADIIPYAPTRWIRKMISEAENVHADLLSVVSPLKTQTGLTSTALGRNPAEFRRLSLAEVYRLPETFTGEAASALLDYPGQLWVNTGCMLCDLRRNRDKWETMSFRTIDRIERPNGKFVATFHPEDWGFSEQAHAQGLKVAATRAVSLVHHGSIDYANDSAWGTDVSDTLK